MPNSPADSVTMASGDTHGRTVKKNMQSLGSDALGLEFLRLHLPSAWSDGVNMLSIRQALLVGLRVSELVCAAICSTPSAFLLPTSTIARKAVPVEQQSDPCFQKFRLLLVPKGHTLGSLTEMHQAIASCGLKSYAVYLSSCLSGIFWLASAILEAVLLDADHWGKKNQATVVRMPGGRSA